MNIDLNPTLEKFIDDQVKQGRFTSHAEALEAGVARLMLDPEPDELTPDEIIELRDSLAQMRRGECVDMGDFAKRMRDIFLK